MSVADGQARPPGEEADEALRLLAARVADEGPPLAVVESRPPAGPPFADLVASGPRTSADPGGYAFVIEAVREGYLCHYEVSRVLDRPDPDLALLAGDLFYAIGISTLAELDDIESVRILSDLIRVSAELRSSGRRREAETMWMAAAMALSCGSDEDYERLSKALTSSDEGATEALERWSDSLANTNGLGRILVEVREAIHFASDT